VPVFHGEYAVSALSAAVLGVHAHLLDQLGDRAGLLLDLVLHRLRFAERLAVAAGQEDGVADPDGEQHPQTECDLAEHLLTSHDQVRLLPEDVGGHAVERERLVAVVLPRAGECSAATRPNASRATPALSKVMSSRW
jgi:hypothetical protein